MDNLDLIPSDIVKRALSAGLEEWVRQAQNGLRSTQVDYINGLSNVHMESPNSGYIELRGRFPVALEKGFPSYDMKDNFSNSSKVRYNKKGQWYMTVPFRHTTPGSNNVQSAMPGNIYREASGLDDGERLKESIVRALGYGPETSWTGYTWKNSKYDSLQRIIKTYDKSIRSQYMTFRRVGQSSDPGSWQHPGFKGLKAVDKVAAKIDQFLYEYR